MSSRTVIGYPGGKSRAISVLRRYFPEGVREMCSPFFGGGSLEFACAADGVRVHGSDAFAPVVNFWRETLRDPVRLAEQVRQYHPLTRGRFLKLQRNYNELIAPLDQAAAFYALNRASFSNTTFSGGFSPGHKSFSLASIERLRNFTAAGVSVELLDFADAVAKHPGKFLYLDPPYAIQQMSKLYGHGGDMHRGFDHQRLADILKGHDGPWLLSYNDCADVREWYAGREFIRVTWAYSMSKHKRPNEVLILGNYEAPKNLARQLTLMEED